MSVPVPYYNQFTAKEYSYMEYMGNLAEATASAMRTNADRQIAAGALFTKEIQSTLVSNQLATETALYNHTQQLDRSLNAGFSAVSRELGYMGSAMSMGFAALNSAVEKSSRAICEKLDDINETLKNPLFTESRELYNRAGWIFPLLLKARSELTVSEEKRCVPLRTLFGKANRPDNIFRKYSMKKKLVPVFCLCASEY